VQLQNDADSPKKHDSNKDPLRSQMLLAYVHTVIILMAGLTLYYSVR
jgi:hypothetical protein